MASMKQLRFGIAVAILATLGCKSGSPSDSSTTQCQAGYGDCNGQCVPLTTSDNCGACGKTCSGATPMCSNGTCVSGCSDAQTKCGSSCVDTTSSKDHCGKCDNKCDSGESCKSGKCVASGAGGSTSKGGNSGKTSAAEPGGESNGGDGGAADGGSTSTKTGTKAAGGTKATSSTTKGGSSGVGGTSGKAVGGTGTGTSAGGTKAATTGTRASDCETKEGMISDFEDGGTDPVVLEGSGISGQWEAFNNADASDQGAKGEQTLKVETSDNTNSCGKNALHTTGKGWGTDASSVTEAPKGWVGIGLTHMAGTKDKPTKFDASKYTGVRFWAKKGSGHAANAAVRFNISTPETEGTGSGGTCTDIDAEGTVKAKRPCYQHVGRFLQNEFDLTTSWKQFSFCFDRDLYPLSLPHNLTNAQRESVAKNMLKIQFQFNKGKDYSSTTYPKDGLYPYISTTAAFDFWLDDLEFFTGDCPNAETFKSTSGTKTSFPQNAKLGSCEPAGNAEKYNAAITQAYARWKANFVKDGKVIAPEQSNGVTTSEAMGYGMLIAAAMGDKDTFGKFWSYVQTQLGAGGSKLMTWSNQGGSGSATDADTDIAYALAMADAQWGGYASAASTMAGAILASDVGTGNALKGGSDWPGRFNPSYFAPSFLRKLGGFASVITKGYQLVSANISASTAGIPTDWADPSTGAPSDKGDAQVYSELTGIVYGYDAARVPLRIGLDVCGGATDGKAALSSMISFFAGKYDQGATIDLLKAGWGKEIGKPDVSARNMQGSFIGPMGVGGMAVGNAAVRDRAFRAILDILESNDFNRTYFPSTVGLITLLIMSGNFPAP